MMLRGLRQVRQQKGLSISQLADMTGVKRELITHLEHCREEPQPYVLRRISSALDVSSDELITLSHEFCSIEHGSVN